MWRSWKPTACLSWPSLIEIKTNSGLRRFEQGVWTDKGGETLLCVLSDTLTGQNFSRSQLDHADLQGQDLHGADFSQADLTAANFTDADLRDTNFRGAALWFVNLHGARLAGADFSGAWMPGAKLHGVDLRGASLAAAELRYARYDEQTLWPDGVDPQERGAKLPWQVREWQG